MYYYYLYNYTLSWVFKNSDILFQYTAWSGIPILDSDNPLLTCAAQDSPETLQAAMAVL